MVDWNTRYATEEYLFGVEPTPFIQRHESRLPPKARVLAVADGEGRNSVFLAASGHRVTAFDISVNALAKARKLAASKGVSVDFREAGTDTWDWAPEAYDALAAIFIQFAGPKPRSEMFQNFDRTLRPGGVLLLHGFAPRQVSYGTGGPPNKENMYTLELLHSAFPGYEVLHEADYDEVIASGSGHNGKAGLIDFVACKPK